MELTFEINKLCDMEMKILVLYNFHENPEINREICLTRYKYGKNTPYGITCEGYVNNDIISIFNSILNKLNKKVISVNSRIMFVDKYKSQYLHRDCEEHDEWFAGVVYLNKKYLIKTGTKIIEPAEEEINIVSNNNIDNNTYMQYLINQYDLIFKDRESIFINAEYNKFIIYPGKAWHSISSGFGDCKLSSRLSESYFIETNINK